jgi:DNA mismatch repair ATPase MutS
MYFSRSINKGRNDVLIGRFNNQTEAYHAQQILMDFGYTKETMRVVELCEFAGNPSDAESIAQRRINRILISGAILVSMVFITLACLFLKSIFSPPEIGVMILVWVTLSSGGVFICAVIGSIVWKLVNSKAVDWGLEAVKRRKILISVKVRTPNDAQEIEREWREIGGEVV